MKILIRLCVVLVLALHGVANAGNVTVTLVGVNPLTINIKGNSQNEEAGNISIYLYFRDDDTTDLEAGNVDASQLETNWGWAPAWAKEIQTTGPWPKGGYNFTRRLYYDHADLSDEPDNFWTTNGVNAIVCTFTSVGSGHAYVEVNGDDGLSDWWLGGFSGHNVTYVNQDVSLPVELSSFTASADNTKITLKWETGSEVDNIGFYVYRGVTADGPFKKISKSIDGAGNSAMGRTYKYIDRKVEPNKTYFYYLEDIDIHSVRNKSDTIQVTMKPPPPKEYKLFQNYPNPFNPETWIPFQLPKAGEVTIRIYNIMGQPIKTIELGSKQAGVYTEKSKAAYWDGRNKMGEKLASGAYFYELRTETFRDIRKMILLK